MRAKKMGVCGVHGGGGGVVHRRQIVPRMGVRSRNGRYMFACYERGEMPWFEVDEVMVDLVGGRGRVITTIMETDDYGQAYAVVSQS